MTPLFYALTSIIIVSSISLIGLFTLSIKKELLHKSIFFLVSLAVGALFGDALIHLIPEAFERIENTAIASFFILSGIIVFFTLEKILRWRHIHTTDHVHEHGSSDCEQEKKHSHIKPLGTLVLISDGMHNFLDGIIVGASYFMSIEVGIATTIAIILHEIPQEISDFALLLHAGFSRKKALFVNFLSALTAILGVYIASLSNLFNENLIPLLTAFAAGGFLYIAGSDLVPELHKENTAKKSIQQLFAILLGIGLMFSLLWLEI